MNYENEFLKDINVRKALSMSIDKESYASVLNKGASVPTRGLYPDFMAFGAMTEKAMTMTWRAPGSCWMKPDTGIPTGTGFWKKTGNRFLFDRYLQHQGGTRHVL